MRHHSTEYVSVRWPLTLVSLALMVRGTMMPSELTVFVTAVGEVVGRVIDFPYSPVRLVVLMLPPDTSASHLELVRNAAGMAYLISLITLGVFVVLQRVRRWPLKNGSFNVWVNLPTFDPTAGGDVVERLERDARFNVALGFLLPFLTPAVVKSATSLFGSVSLENPHTLIWTVAAWAFLPASLFMRRHRHGSDCRHDPRKAPYRQRRRAGNARRALAGLILSFGLAAPSAASDNFRVALFHTEFARDGPGLLYRDLISAKDEQIEAGLRLLLRINADILVLGGLDYDHHHLALNALVDRLGGYSHTFTSTPNRGLASGLDLDRDGRVGGPDDAFGYGEFRGSNGLAVLSRFPLIEADLLNETGRKWLELSGNIAPEGTLSVERVSSTSHWRLPFSLPSGREIAVVIWHATPPVFDGHEDRNGRRNHDETVLALRMIEDSDRPVIAAGLANLDPVDGEGRKVAIERFLDHERLQDPNPGSAGGARAALDDGGINIMHRGDPSLDTVDWPDNDNRPGNLRTDYILPDKDFSVAASGVLWPEDDGTLRDDVLKASRHRIVWMDLSLDPLDH